MVFLNTSIPGPGRVVIYGQGGALAGDLAAGLSGIFQVERVATLSEAVHALVKPALAMLIISDDPDPTEDPAECDLLVRRAAARECRLLVLGDNCPYDARGVERLSDVPGPAELACRLVDVSPAGGI